MADEANNSTSDGVNNTADATQTDEKQTKAGKTFSQEELGQKLSEERKKLREGFDKEMEERIAKEKSEWERQSRLTEEQRAKEAQEAERKELDEREHNITMRERRSEAIEKLTEKGISSKLVDFVVDADADKTDENIATLEKEFNKAVEDAVKAKLSGTTPTDRSTTTPSSKTADSMSKGIYSKNSYHAI